MNSNIHIRISKIFLVLAILFLTTAGILAIHVHEYILATLILYGVAVIVCNLLKKKTGWA